ncbi:hypothetical protein [Streptomyces sp. NPDC001492]
MNLLKRAAVGVASVALMAGGAGVAFAGQPNASCEDIHPATPPGNSASAPGSAFSGGTADLHYAGSGPGSAHAGSDNAVSQYDVACTHNQSSR